MKKVGKKLIKHEKSKDHGEGYDTYKGNKVPSKAVKPSTCKKCKEPLYCKKITEDEKNSIHDDYWKIENIEGKRQFIISRVEECEPSFED